MSDFVPGEGHRWILTKLRYTFDQRIPRTFQSVTLHGLVGQDEVESYLPPLPSQMVDCRVYFRDPLGVEHSTEVRAGSVYEAVCGGWAAFMFAGGWGFVRGIVESARVRR